MPLSLLVATLCLSVLAQASTNHLDRSNLAYRSPYANHDSLAVDTHAIAKRHEESHAILRKRQVKQAAPKGEPDNYITAGYGLGVVDWADASYIFGGNLNFTHAVASGDPYDYSVLLWTRALPVEQAAVDVPVCVTYNVFDGLDGSVRISSYPVNHTHPTTSGQGRVQRLRIHLIRRRLYRQSRSDRLESFHLLLVPVCQLCQARAKVRYREDQDCACKARKKLGHAEICRLQVCSDVYMSLTPTDGLRLSCSNWPNGFFNAYRAPVDHQDVDYVLHLGDYMYVCRCSASD